MKFWRYRSALFFILIFVCRAFSADLDNPTVAPPQKADSLVVKKAERLLLLFHQGEVIKKCRIALGRNPVGPKLRKGDGRTPEGRYLIDGRNPRSRYYLSLHISYPDSADWAKARGKRKSPGANIMIHGTPRGYGYPDFPHRIYDWTNGCIAVTNKDMKEIWALVDLGTPITILP